jgi:F0F1-type ATP synthase membrane subunit b/b'
VERSDDVGDGVARRASSDEEAPARRTDHGTTGAKVAAVLNAAEEAAETIRGDATREANEILRQAKVDATARVDELTRDAERVRTEADDYAKDIRDAVDSYGTQARREAEEEARKILADAEDQARATREAAQDMATQIEADARRRHESLTRESKSLEERRQRVLDGLRDLTAQLQDALVEPPSREIDESLADALDVERRR